MQLLWGARASRPQFSASRLQGAPERPYGAAAAGRKHFAAKIQSHLVPSRRAGSRRRDAGGRDRDGRAPHFQLHRYG